MLYATLKNYCLEPNAAYDYEEAFFRSVDPDLGRKQDVPSAKKLRRLVYIASYMRRYLKSTTKLGEDGRRKKHARKV